MKNKRFKLNEKVCFQNPFYLDLGLFSVSSKFCLGHIKDFDSDYIIIQRDSDKEEFYIHNSKVYKKATKKELLKKWKIRFKI